MIRIQITYFTTMPEIQHRQEKHEEHREVSDILKDASEEISDILKDASDGLAEYFGVTARVYEKFGAKYSTLREVELCFNVCDDVQYEFLDALRAVVMEEPTTRSLVKFQKKVRSSARF